MNPLEIIQTVFGEEYEFNPTELMRLKQVIDLAVRNCLEWQPIETAPRDGTEILLWEGEFETYAVGYFCEAEGRWQVFPGTGTITPSHWMPLPEPPEES